MACSQMRHAIMLIVMMAPRWVRGGISMCFKCMKPQEIKIGIFLYCLQSVIFKVIVIITHPLLGRLISLLSENNNLLPFNHTTAFQTWLKSYNREKTFCILEIFVEFYCTLSPNTVNNSYRNRNRKVLKNNGEKSWAKSTETLFNWTWLVVFKKPCNKQKQHLSCFWRDRKYTFNIKL